MVISEVVELVKCYSGEDGYKFINGVLWRVFDKINVIWGVKVKFKS